MPQSAIQSSLSDALINLIEPCKAAGDSADSLEEALLWGDADGPCSMEQWEQRLLLWNGGHKRWTLFVLHLKQTGLVIVLLPGEGVHRLKVAQDPPHMFGADFELLCKVVLLDPLSSGQSI